VWDFPEVRPRLTIRAGGNDDPVSHSSITQLAFTPDGKTLLTNGGPRMVRAWDVLTGHPERAIAPAHAKHVGLAYSPKGGVVATATSDGIVLWDLAAGSPEALPWPDQVPAEGGCLAFSPDGTILAGNSRNNVLLWDIAAPRARPPLSGHQGGVKWAAFLPGGKTLASLSADGEVKLWSVLTGQELLSLRDHRGLIWSVAFSPVGRMLAVATSAEGSEGEVRLWLPPEAKEEPPGSN
jgi:WD40 repeat protein